jgi:hypothetical protein
MSEKRSEQTPASQVLVCSNCQGKFRIRPTSAGKMLRCPHCRNLVSSGAAPVQPGPAAARSASQVRTSASRSEDEGDQALYAARPAEANRPLDEPEIDPVEDIEIRRKKPPPFVAPLWVGVYGFPWHPSGIRAWLLFGIGFSLVAFMAAAVHYVLDLYESTDFIRAGIWQRVLPLYVAAFGLFLVWTGTFAGSFFLETIRGGAAGHNEVDRPDDTIAEKFFTFLGLAWVFLLCAAPLGILLAPLQWHFGARIMGWSLIPSTILIFPLGLLSSMANDSRLNILNGEVVGNSLRHPLTILILYVMSVPLLAVCIALGFLTIGNYEQFIFLAPLTGFAWSACLLIYGRLLGRVAWIITGEQEEALRDARRVKKRRRR